MNRAFDSITREPISSQTREKILERDGHCCRYCGSKTGPFHLDHVYPFSKGGETTEDNLVTSCERCNLSKHSKVGMWPKPIGYFDHKQVLIRRLVLVHGISLILASISIFLLLLVGNMYFVLPALFFTGINIGIQFFVKPILK